MFVSVQQRKRKTQFNIQKMRKSAFVIMHSGYIHLKQTELYSFLRLPTNFYSSLMNYCVVRVKL